MSSNKEQGFESKENDPFKSHLNTDKMRIGKYIMDTKAKESNYVYLPESVMRQSSFNFDDVFKALNLETPQLIFQLNKAEIAPKWNIKIPESREQLHKLVESIEVDTTNPLFEHYYGVLKENVRRMMRSVSATCIQAKAIYRLIPLWYDKLPVDVVSNFISEISNIPMIGTIERSQLNEEVFAGLIIRSKKGAEDNEDDPPYKINFSEWLNNSKPIGFTEAKGPFNTVPHPDITHLILTDNLILLNEKMKESIPQGLIVMNGKTPAVTNFVNGINEGEPIFILKNTGDASDLICEFLEKAESYKRRLKSKPDTKLMLPFPVDSMKDNYRPKHWLKPFNHEMVRMAKQLNIAMENLPERFNPHSILQIDMFHTSDDKLQDQLTRVMSTVYEGMVEIGGSGPEAKRLSYAWQLRYLFKYNAALQQNRSNNLWALIVFFTLLSTVSPIVYLYLEINQPSFYNDTGSNVLVKLNLIFPLVATVLRGAFAILSPETKAITLKRAFYLVESEIYKYRTKVGKYSMLKKKVATPADNNNVPTQSSKGSSNDKKQNTGNDDSNSNLSGNPSKAFSKALSDVWDSLSSSDSLYEPMGEIDPVEDVQDRIKANQKFQKKFSTQALLVSRHHEDDDNFKDIESGNHSESDDETNSLVERDRSDSVTVNKIASSLIGTVQRGAATVQRGAATVQRSAANIPIPLGENPLREDEDKKVSVDVKALAQSEDGLIVLTAENYIAMRIIPVLAELSSKTSPLSSSVNISACSIILLSVISSALAPFGQSVWIPVALSLSAAVSSWATHTDKDSKLQNFNGSIQLLHKLIVWWNSLSIIERRVISNKEILVTSGEDIIMLAYAHLANKTDFDNQDITSVDIDE